jgi:hypothetical protein
MGGHPLTHGGAHDLVREDVLGRTEIQLALSGLASSSCATVGCLV